MKEKVIAALAFLEIGKEEIENLIEVPKEKERGDYAFPCFVLAKKMKKNPVEIASEVAGKIKGKSFEKVEAVGPYVNFFVDRKRLADEILKKALKEKNNYGKNKSGNGKKLLVEMSSPNIAKPFHVGHLRSTIIGNSISKISEFNGFKVVKINYLGDWGTQFGKLIVGYNKFGDEKKLKDNPIKHLLEIYVEANKKEYEDDARAEFKKLEEGDREAVALWKRFREMSLKKFDKIYERLGVKFDVVSGESFYNKKMEKIVEELKKKKLLELSDGAQVVDLEKYGLGVAIVKKSDGATLYITRDIAAAIERYEKYKFERMIYEVGSEQKLHFRQLFKILEMMGHKWAEKCVHVDHGLYLDKDGKKFATRKGKAVFMEDIFDEAEILARKEIEKRYKIGKEKLNERAIKIARAAILYGDMKNYRGDNVVFDIGRLVSFEGDTGPYLLYSYARAKSILKKAKSGKANVGEIEDVEKSLVLEIARFPEVVENAYKALAPNLIANYSFSLAQKFNEFYHGVQVIGSEREQFRIELVRAFAQTMKNSLGLLGIDVVEEM